MTRWFYLHVVRPMRFWWQRRVRGFDDSVTWDLDTALACWLLPRLIRFKQINNGYPSDLTESSWDAILDEMIAGLRISAYREMVVDEARLKRERRAWKMLAKWHGHLWW